MKLSSLLKPSVWDEKILKQYTRLTKRWEEKGGNKYNLAYIFNTSAMMSSLIPYWTYTPKAFSLNFINYAVLSPSHILDIYRTKEENKLDNENSTDGTKIEQSKFLYGYKKVANFARLPFLLYGTGFVLKGLVGIGSYFINNDADSLGNGVLDIFLGYGFIGNASSMYVKDSDPKLLQKDTSNLDDVIEEEIFSNISLVPIPVMPDNKNYS